MIDQKREYEKSKTRLRRNKIIADYGSPDLWNRKGIQRETAGTAHDCAIRFFFECLFF